MADRRLTEEEEAKELGKADTQDEGEEVDVAKEDKDIENIKGDNDSVPKEENIETSVTDEKEEEEGEGNKADEEAANIIESSPEGEGPSQKTTKKEDEDVYKLKWILWHGRKTPIITQNENGPCPLIAISNLLLLRGKISFPGILEMVTAKQLVEYIGDAILSNRPMGEMDPRVLDYEQNLSDAFTLLQQLHTGLNVNVRFTGVTHFEYTPACIIFDLLDIPLYHGWVIDPQCHEVVNSIGTLGYNQVVEKIINDKTSDEVALVTEALVAEQFLERTATQLTHHGLCELHASMKNNELGVLFRNNHFSTILKRQDEVFQLVTDQGFLNEPRVVWETLSNIDGDGRFVDGAFRTAPLDLTSSYSTQDLQNDYLVALSLEEEQKLQESERVWEDLKQMQEIASDEEFARRVHEEEQRHTHSPIAVGGMSHSHPRQFAHTASGERSKKGSCDIL